MKAIITIAMLISALFSTTKEKNILKYGSQSRLTGFVKKWKWPEKLEIVQIIQYNPVSVVHIVQCTSGGSGGRIRHEICQSYRNIGK